MISLDKTKIGPKPVRFFLPRLPQPLININRNAVLQRKGMEIATVLPQPLDTSACLPLACGLISWWVSSSHSVDMNIYPLGISFVQTFHRVFPLPFQQCPVTFQQPLRALPRCYRQKQSNFGPYSQKPLVYNSFYYKLKSHRNFSKTLSSSSPDTDLSNNITLGQSQSHAIQVNKHRTADSTDFVLVQERRTYYHHRHSAIDETNISTQQS